MSDLITVKMEELGEVMGEFRPYNPQVIPAHIEGTRVVKCLYKATANNKEPRSNEYVRIPDHIAEEAVQEHMSELMDYFIGFLQDTEDTMIKADHKAYVSKVYTEHLSIPKLIDFLESQETSGRLTKEKISEWFDAVMLEPLVSLFAEKLDDDEEKVTAIIKAYKGKFESLAGGRTFIKKDDCEALLAAMNKADEITGEVMSSSLAKRFVKRLTSMEEKESDLLMSL